MRYFVCIAVVLATVLAVTNSMVIEQQPQQIAVDAQVNPEAEALLAVDAQGHENTGDREARQFGYGGFGGYRGGYGGGYGGYRGGYGGGFGGYRGGYGGYGGGGYGGGYRGGYGGYRGGFYG